LSDSEIQGQPRGSNPDFASLNPGYLLIRSVNACYAQVADSATALTRAFKYFSTKGK
jgi:hypothetical protein